MINIVTALACEARPIIRHFGLKKTPSEAAFPVYRNDTVNLVIAGVGKFAAAAAVGYLRGLPNPAAGGAQEGAAPQAWLNVGIAGHKSLALGTALLGHRISDVSGTCRFYPCFTFELPCATAEVITVERPERAYAADAAYDMEALGFCAAAARFSSFELIHCLKIVSDNSIHSHTNVTKQAGEDLVGGQLPVIENLMSAFEALRQATQCLQAPSQDYGLLTGLFRFTVAQQNQLKRLLQRWRLLENAPVYAHLPLQDFKNAGQVLLAMEARLQSRTFHCQG